MAHPLQSQPADWGETTGCAFSGSDGAGCAFSGSDGAGCTFSDSDGAGKLNGVSKTCYDTD